MSLKRFFVWVSVFHKRFLKKKGFLFLLALIPLAGLALGLVARMDSGVMTVYLSSKDNDPISMEIINELSSENGLIRFVVSDEEEAIKAVKYGEADSAWVFEEKLGEKIRAFAHKRSAKNHLVDIFQRDEDIMAMLMREKLGGVLYPYIGHELYIDFVHEELSESIPNETMEEYYASVMPEGSKLFDLSENTEMKDSSEYLSAPLRGLLSVLCVLGGMAVSMFWIRDREKGLFFGLGGARLHLFCFAYHFVAVFDLCLVMVASLYVSGRGGILVWEMFSAILFALAVTLFCMIILYITNRISILVAVAPLLLLIMLIICPVFFKIGPLEMISKLFPPHYYLAGTNPKEYFAYILCEAILLLCLGLLRQKQKNIDFA